MKKIIYTLIIISCLIIAGFSAHAQAGSLDTTFGNGGIVNTDFSNSNDQGRSVALQSDGKMVLVGYSSNSLDNDFALIRYNMDGTLDNAFGTNGKVTTGFGSGDDYARAVAIQSDGKIVVAGYSFDGSDYVFALARYNNNGGLDNSFGTAGKVTTNVANGPYANAMIIQPDGKIVVAGNSNSWPNEDFILVRYNSDGTLDNSFGTNGIVFTDFVNSSFDGGRGLAMQPDGKIVVAGFTLGTAGMDFALARFNTDGSLDNSFDSDGKVSTDFGNGSDEGYAIIIQSDGKIVVSGYCTTIDIDFALARYNDDGSLDSTFGIGGKVRTPILDSEEWAYSLAIQQNGKIVAAGSSYNFMSGYNDFILACYNTDGSLDTTFGTVGKVITNVGLEDIGYSVVIQNDGKIVVAGVSDNGSNDDFAIVRYNGTVNIGISNVAFQTSKVKIYPNPVSEVFTVKSARISNEVLTLSIYNLMGSLVKTETLEQNQQQINVQDLNNGIYIIEIRSKEWTEKQKLIIER